ncbi:tyrosine-type recombinase/integrase [Aureimonas sp. D3]|uniref:tyrosine-type recombinase/integrase n=1 Tax=Aureimonas sp. D3 TaxID=1638164 RepID=UPI0007851043|nr:site-specific integrase [Aureimonas sp. D3]
MASVSKREWDHNGETKTAWVVRYTDNTGKRRLKTFDKKKDADRFRTQVETEVGNGVHIAASDTVTLSEALDNWLKKCDARAHVGDRMRHNTARNFRCLADVHLRPAFGTTLLTDLTARRVQKFLDDLAYDPAKPRSHALLKHLAAILRMCLKHAVTMGHVGRNIMVEADIRIPGTRPKRKEIPTKDELRELLARSGDVLGMGGVARYLRPLVYTAVFTGLRQGELRALRWDDVDFAAGIIRVRRSADQFGRIGETKSHAGIRDVPIAPALAPELKRWKLASAAKSEEGLVFVGNRGRMVQPACIQQSWGRLQRRVLADAKEKGAETRYFARGKYHFHQLRHVAASLFIETGLPPKRIQTIMGHSTISMTFDRYGHLFDDPAIVEEAMRKIGQDLVSTAI